MLTPSEWNPCCNAYVTKQESMIEWEGNITDKRDRQQIFPSDIPKDKYMMASVQISSADSVAIDQVLHMSNYV